MAELKTKKTAASVADFIAGLKDEQQQADARQVVKIMTKASGSRPKMWGPSIIGFGDHHFVYKSGRECDWFLCGFSPRKGNLSLYIMGGFPRHGDLLKKLGKYKIGGSCLYVKRLSDVDGKVLAQMVQQSIKHIKSAKGPIF